MKESQVERTLRLAKIEDVISDHIELTSSGKNYMGICPFHKEKTASFTVSPSKQMFHCFGCHKGGNVFKFLMDYKGIPFGDAVEELRLRYDQPVKLITAYELSTMELVNK